MPHKLRKSRLIAGVLLTVSLVASAYLWAVSARGQASGAVVEDIFGRVVNQNGIVLVDWEGYMANPALKLFVKPPSNIAFPATAVLSSSAPRLYFDLPSTFGASGPSKTVTLSNASSSMPFLLSIFPDRDTADEDYTLTIRLTDANGAQTTQRISVHVVDQDKTDPQPFQITLDFTKDQTGFFGDAAKRDIVRQAANDWAYFFAGMNLDAVPAGTETTFIWSPTGFHSGHHTTNISSYKGFLLYTYGIHTDQLRSGGEPSFNGGFQTSGGGSITLPLKRSGGVEAETQGNYNTLGWFLTTGDNDWHVTGNLGHEQNDLYSIMHHEIGHALIFNPSHTRFRDFKNMGSVQAAAVLAYHGSPPPIDQFDHLNGSVDRQGRRGAFGYEYFGDVPRRRWLITKLDLLVAQAIGYQLRTTSALIPLSVQTSSLPAGTADASYSAALQAQGGIPFYNWTIDSGELPSGLSLNSFTGAITGTPTQTGTFNFNVRVRDYGEGTAGVTRALSITINPNSTQSVQFSAANFQVGEGDLRAAVTLTRTGDTSGAVAVDYRTVDADTFTVGCADAVGAATNAYARCDFATAVGTVTFAPGETSKTATVPVIDDGHVEGPETFQLRLSNPSGAMLGAVSATTVTITDNDAAGAPNPVVSSVPFFVRQQYLDFLSREPDQGGFNAWSGVLNNCPNIFTGPEVQSGCDRILVSGDGFFRSVEFQLKGAYVFRFYKVGFNRLPEYVEIVSDMSFVAGQTAEEVFARRAQLATLFTQQQEFKSAYDGMTNQQYVAALLGRYNLQQVTTPDPASPDAGGKVTLTATTLAALPRDKALRAVVDSDEVTVREFDNAFVAMQYYGYLRRKPDQSGYEAWLRVLRSGDTRTMVNGFLNSAEYKLRFGQP